MEKTADAYLRARSEGKRKNEIANLMGISIPTLYNRLEEWGITSPEIEKRMIAAVKAKSSAAADTAPSDTMDEDAGVDWFVKGDPGLDVLVVRRGGLRLHGSAFSHFKADKTYRVGYDRTKKMIVFKEERGAWKVHAVTSNSAMIGTKAVATRLVDTHRVEQGAAFEFHKVINGIVYFAPVV